ncbi:hypothetical protein FB45DRAFT_1113825 [Roridomyces roridus]|uniref:MYND-type domain-containing protein n=1 Tax=Roridomyces roridus TaxID=1738132 RepID=A0AAD7CAW3_9AGAR|nr:hypothetical protein FB45DRAFT_1113825 [Roridomyces roridus]
MSNVARAAVLASIFHFLFACARLQGYALCYWFNAKGTILRFIGRIWWLDANWSIPMPLGDRTTGDALHFVLLSWARDKYDTKGITPSKALYADEVLKQTGNDVLELAGAAVDHLIGSIQDEDRRAIGVHAMVILLLARQKLMQRSFIAQNTLDLIVRASKRAVRSRFGICDQLSGTAVASSCTYLETCMRGGDGVSSVARAFEAGFLSCFLAGFDATTHQEYLDLFKNRLSTYLVHLPVVRSAAKAFKKIKKAEIERRMSRRGPLWEAWVAFKKTLEERIEVAGETVHLICGSRMCNRIDFTDDCLRYCVGCMDKAYCSAECQRQDWKTDGHRKLCKEMRWRRIENHEIELSDENRAFMDKVIAHDRIANMPTAFEIIHQTRQFALEFDYTMFPLKVLPVRGEVIEKPGYTIFQVKVPVGGYSYTFQIEVLVPQDVADSLRSGNLNPVFGLP